MSTGQSPQVKMTADEVAAAVAERREREKLERDERMKDERSRSRARKLLGR